MFLVSFDLWKKHWSSSVLSASLKKNILQSFFDDNFFLWQFSHENLAGSNLNKNCQLPFTEKQFVRICRFSGRFVFGLNTERYSVFFHMQSECGKIRIRTTTNTDTFYAVTVPVKHLWWSLLASSNTCNVVKFSQLSTLMNFLQIYGRYFRNNMFGGLRKIFRTCSL